MTNKTKFKGLLVIQNKPHKDKKSTSNKYPIRHDCINAFNNNTEIKKIEAYGCIPVLV